MKSTFFHSGSLLMSLISYGTIAGDTLLTAGDNTTFEPIMLTTNASYLGSVATYWVVQTDGYIGVNT